MFFYIKNPILHRYEIPFGTIRPTKLIHQKLIITVFLRVFLGVCVTACAYVCMCELYIPAVEKYNNKITKFYIHILQLLLFLKKTD